MDPEGLGGKRLMDYDVIVAMENKHRDYVLSLCPSVRIGFLCEKPECRRRNIRNF